MSALGNKNLWWQVLLLLGTLFFFVVVGMVLTWAFVSEQNYGRYLRPGDSYTIGSRTYRLPQVPLYDQELNPLPYVKILSQDFLQRQRRLLAQTHQLMKQLNISYFLSGGTLIGFTMPHLESMMPHDDDLDIHVSYKHRDYLWSKEFAKVCASMGLEALYLRVSTLQLATREGAAVRLRWKGQRMPVLDIFFEQQDPKDGLWKKIDSWGPRGVTYNKKECWHADDVFPLTLKQVDGLELSFPHRPQALLEKQYSKKVHERIVVPHRMLSHAFPYLVFGSAIWRSGDE